MGGAGLWQMPPESFCLQKSLSVSVDRSRRKKNGYSSHRPIKLKYVRYVYTIRRSILTAQSIRHTLIFGRMYGLQLGYAAHLQQMQSLQRLKSFIFIPRKTPNSNTYKLCITIIINRSILLTQNKAFNLIYALLLFFFQISFVCACASALLYFYFISCACFWLPGCFFIPSNGK